MNRESVPNDMGPILNDPRREEEKETGRVEAFSDGVIAIAITLLILEIKVPTIADVASAGLLAKLLSLWPSFLAFLTSFGTILVMWVNHHRIFRLVRTTDYPFLYWNGLLLLLITFVPFPTALLAQHLAGPEATVATAFYSGTFVAIALAFNGVWGHLRRHPHLLLASANPSEIAGITKQYRFGPLPYLIAFSLAFVSVLAALATCLALAIFFAIADRPTNADSVGK
ncbi:MAG TPA: TMEM175 family protein [Gemmataceae bacterium]|nr:TMEM175 family protein [Gemmataceae bacterium]